MKILKLLFISVSMLMVHEMTYAQNFMHNTILKQKPDTVYFFPPIGTISCLVNGKKQPNDSLNNVFQYHLTQILPSITSFETCLLGPESELDDSMKTYFINTVPKFSKISENTFSIITLGKTFNKMIENHHGRYFGIIFYEGFETINLEGKLATAIFVSVAATVLTGGLYTFIPVTNTERYLISDVLIIDKQTDRYVYYCRNHKHWSPIKPNRIKSFYSNIFGYYYKTQN